MSAIPVPASSGSMVSGLVGVFLSGGRRIDPSSESTKLGESSDNLTNVHVEKMNSTLRGGEKGVTSPSFSFFRGAGNGNSNGDMPSGGDIDRLDASSTSVGNAIFSLVASTQPSASAVDTRAWIATRIGNGRCGHAATTWCEFMPGCCVSKGCGFTGPVVSTD